MDELYGDLDSTHPMSRDNRLNDLLNGFAFEADVLSGNTASPTDQEAA
jgi:hypothetical protein